ncbi:MAG TPA: aldolase [Casimicrobiaceae bacterium]|jgi:ribulose-5-phosphate 4-epimerase/fuculose-1-phosphate aldolase|nr:aldolase [Casimicrobiaceae bacterium]
MTEDHAREEICRVARSLFERGYAHATAGNVSVRLDDDAGGGFLITPTDACLGFLEPARLARIDGDGRQIGGDPASKTLALHRRIYAAAGAFDPGTRAIIHTHSTHAVALTLRRTDAELLAPITPYFVMKVGHVPVIPYARPGAPQVADAVAACVTRYGEAGMPIRAVMLARLGPTAWHASPAAAMAVIEELEATARLAMLVDPPPAPLAASDIDDLRRAFGARW